ncbi:MAG: hypothetical protein ACT6WH_04105 [Sphingopyxis sp.]|jgi:hypothetical protein
MDKIGQIPKGRRNGFDLVSARPCRWNHHQRRPREADIFAISTPRPRRTWVLTPDMVDNFSLGLTHVLMAIALWRLLHRDDLDREVSPRLLWQQRRDAERAEADARPDA